MLKKSPNFAVFSGNGNMVFKKENCLFKRQKNADRYAARDHSETFTIFLSSFRFYSCSLPPKRDFLKISLQKCENNRHLFPERLLLAAEIGNDLRADGPEFGRFAHRGGRPGLGRAGRHEAQPTHGRARVRDAQERLYAAQLRRVRY
jgi:hypothetical protein